MSNPVRYCQHCHGDVACEHHLDNDQWLIFIVLLIVGFIFGIIYLVYCLEACETNLRCTRCHQAVVNGQCRTESGGDCGTPLYCKNCGSRLQDDAVFCHECGGRVR